MRYAMSGPDGEKFYGVWEVTAVDAPHSFSFRDGFADENFQVNPDLPVSESTFSFAEHEGGTRAT